MTAVLQRPTRRAIAELPGPRGVPGAGNALQLRKTAAPPVRERFGFTMQPTGLRVHVRARS